MRLAVEVGGGTGGGKVLDRLNGDPTFKVKPEKGEGDGTKREKRTQTER